MLPTTREQSDHAKTAGEERECGGPAHVFTQQR